MKRILIIVPELVAPPGLVGQAVIESGFAYDAVFPESRFASHAPLDYPGLPGEPGTYAGLIVLGGPMSANDIEKHSFLKETMRLIVGFHEAGKPVLGICLGAQIIARSFGGEVYRMAEFESGFYRMELTPAGRADPLFRSVEAPFPVFQNHYEATRDTPGSTVLAAGGACPVQAFRLGRATYGLQFHIEVTIDIVRDWIRVFGAAFCRDEPRLLTDLDRQFATHFADYRRLCHHLIRQWLNLTGV
jgi:GMP synthase-like glutamine amidotransferase